MNAVPVVVHADDFGLSRSFNRGIAAAIAHGVVRSTSLRTNGSAYREAVEEFLPQWPHVGVGVHLNIVEGKSGRSLTSRSRLCDADGRYRLGFFDLWRLCLDQRLLGEIEIEYCHQIETVLKDGVVIDHLNSHQHSHILPPLFEIVCRLAHRYDIPYVRLVKEAWHQSGYKDVIQCWYWVNRVKHKMASHYSIRNETAARAYGVRTNSAFVGLLYTGHMTVPVIQAALKAGVGPGPVEILLHTVLKEDGDSYLHPDVKKYAEAPERAKDMETALSSQMISLLQPPSWRLTNYRELASVETKKGTN